MTINYPDIKTREANGKMNVSEVDNTWLPQLKNTQTDSNVIGLMPNHFIIPWRSNSATTSEVNEQADILIHLNGRC